MHVALRYAGIKKVVQSKIQAAEFQAMMGLFMKLYVSIELSRFARLVGNVDDDEVEFERQARNEFNKLLAVQGDGADELDLEKLGNADAGTQAIGMEGTSLTSIVKCLGEYDTNGDGLSPPLFCSFTPFCTPSTATRSSSPSPPMYSLNCDVGMLPFPSTPCCKIIPCRQDRFRRVLRHAQSCPGKGQSVHRC